MVLRPNRRILVQGLTALMAGGARAAEPGGLEVVLNPGNGPPMACAGVIARRGDGSLAFQAAAGAAGGTAFTLERVSIQLEPRRQRQRQEETLIGLALGA